MAGIVQINGKWRSETGVYNQFWGWAVITGIALFIIAAVAAGGKFRGSNAALGGTLIGVTAVMLTLAYVIPRMLGIKKNAANGMYAKDSTPEALKKTSYLYYLVAITVLFGMCVLGALAIKGKIPNQKLIGGIALGILGGGTIATMFDRCFGIKTMSYGEIQAKIKSEEDAARDRNIPRGTIHYPE